MVVTMMVALIEADVITVPKMATATVEMLATTLKGEETFENFNITDELAKPLHAMAEAIENSGGKIPTELDGLIANKVDHYVARKMMQQVFGSTDIIIEIHTRTIVCALDLFDWEETENVTLKSDIKMKQISAERVKQSLQTWLPRGQRLEFQETMMALGEVFKKNHKGFWGKLQSIISKTFKGDDKNDVMEMVNDIVRFYKIVKCGKRKKYTF